MNPDTGHLVNTGDLSEQGLFNLLTRGYIEVPPELSRAARKKLAGKKEAMVSLKSGGKLSRWSAKQRKRLKLRSYKDYCR